MLENLELNITSRAIRPSNLSIPHLHAYPVRYIRFIHTNVLKSSVKRDKDLHRINGAYISGHANPVRYIRFIHTNVLKSNV